MALGTVEIYIILFFIVIAIIGTLLVKKYVNKYLKPISILLFGIAGIFLFVGLITPPDIISNFILSIPATIIFSGIVIVKLIRKVQ